MTSLADTRYLSPKLARISRYPRFNLENGMNSFLLNRTLGSISPQNLERAHTTQLLQSLQPASEITFNLEKQDEGSNNVYRPSAIAHKAGVNSLAIDRFEGRWLLSGGADSSLSIWDLESSTFPSYLPTTAIPRIDSDSTFGFTHLSYYPFDSLAFLSTSYSHHLRLHSSLTLLPTFSISLESVAYTHAVSEVASHLLVAVGTQHQAVRLVDLKSGSAIHSLPGHSGAVLAVGWCPKSTIRGFNGNTGSGTGEWLLASGSADGTVRLWDVRRSSAALGMLDMDDSVGLTLGGNSSASQASTAKEYNRNRDAKAHNGAVNSLTWTADGQYLITAGHDERIRVWNTSTGANTLVNFGPTIRNRSLATVHPIFSPQDWIGNGRDLMFWPNEKEILGFEWKEGRLVKRLKVPKEIDIAARLGKSAREGAKVDRVTGLAWRAHETDFYSSHADGRIRGWKPAMNLDEDEDVSSDEEDAEFESEDRKRKREELDELYENITKRSFLSI
ncbi:MAG: hypothetical protein M1820_004999 [Bogoriella megaspora]|nr:MAG: hypothetical protein M1820_004999 [Bogoriella megaspora]